MKKKTNNTDRIEINPKIMLGKPVVKGTRITVEIILQKLANGQTEEQIISSYPLLTKEDIKACIQYAANLVSLEEVITI